MNRVLRAEQDARAAVDVCRGEAAAMVAAAEALAKRVVQATDRRIRAAHQRADQTVEQAVRALLGTPPVAPVVSPAEGDDELDRAVAALADEIIGARR
jgi:regulator of protease activity HflC (stomatin/prohibitin superfamily)